MIDFPEYKLFDQTGEVSRFINRQNFRRTDDQTAVLLQHQDSLRLGF